MLLTFEDTERRRRWLNARATLEVLLGQRAFPVIYENDSVATDELRFGDNDRLSARVAQMVRGDLLVLLSDVDGLYTADPARNPAAVHIPFVAEVTAEIERLAMVYEPLDTRFLVTARDNGGIAIDGLTMVIGQARAAFCLFFGVQAPSGEHECAPG